LLKSNIYYFRNPENCSSNIEFSVSNSSEVLFQLEENHTYISNLFTNQAALSIKSVLNNIKAKSVEITFSSNDNYKNITYPLLNSSEVFYIPISEFIPSTGLYTIEVKAYKEDNRNGDMVGYKKIDFTINNQCGGEE